MICYEQEFLTKEVLWGLIPTLLQMVSVMRPTVRTKFGEALQTAAKQTAGTLILKKKYSTLLLVFQNTVLFLMRQISDHTKKYLPT